MKKGHKTIFIPYFDCIILLAFIIHMINDNYAINSRMQKKNLFRLIWYEDLTFAGLCNLAINIYVFFLK